MTSHRVQQLGHSGALPRRKHGRGYLYGADEVQGLAEQRRGWISAAKAGEMTGLSPRSVRRAAHRGEIVMRRAPRAVPALWEESVRSWAANLPPAKPPPKTPAPPPSTTPTTPPEDGNLWLSRAVTAGALGLSTSRITQLATTDRIPHVRRGRRLWFRSDHIERIAAARAFHQLQEHPDRE